MSEYQYYEFRAIDKPLSGLQIQELRTFSSRAVITPNSFVNTYHYGNFKGNPDTFIEKYFDAFLYVSNWGTHRLMIRLPKHLFDKSEMLNYCLGDGLSCREKDDSLILDFNFEIETGSWEQGESWLPSVIQLRSDLMAGDYRCLYLGWLGSLQRTDLDFNTKEPNVPAGLNELTSALNSFANFIALDPNLIEVAAKCSTPLTTSDREKVNLRNWIQSLPLSEREDLLLKFIENDDIYLRQTLLQQLRMNFKKGPQLSRRTVHELFEEVQVLSKEKERIIQERLRIEKERNEAQQALAKTQYLNDLKKRQVQVWKQIESLIEAKKSSSYDQAVQLICDLKDLFKADRVSEANK